MENSTGERETAGVGSIYITATDVITIVCCSLVQLQTHTHCPCAHYRTKVLTAICTPGALPVW